MHPDCKRNGCTADKACGDGCVREPEFDLAEAYEERIEHLRTYIQMLGDDFNNLRIHAGLPPIKAPEMVLAADVERSVAMDRRRS